MMRRNDPSVTTAKKCHRQFAGDIYSQYWETEHTVDELQQLYALGAMPLDPTGSANAPPAASQLLLETLITHTRDVGGVQSGIHGGTGP